MNKIESSCEYFQFLALAFFYVINFAFVILMFDFFFPIFEMFFKSESLYIIDIHNFFFSIIKFVMYKFSFVPLFLFSYQLPKVLHNVLPPSLPILNHLLQYLIFKYFLKANKLIRYLTV